MAQHLKGQLGDTTRQTLEARTYDVGLVSRNQCDMFAHMGIGISLPFVMQVVKCICV